MKTRAAYSFAFLVAAITLLSALGAGSHVHAGTFEDRDGARHPWLVDERHTLIWDGAPYLPFGIVFEPKYLSAAQTAENWASDEAEVGAMKLAGLRDVLVRPGRSVADIPVEAWQKVIDLLEANGFRYGVELDDSPYAALVGYVVDPAVNRVEDIRSPGELTADLPNTKLAFYALCDAKTAEVVDLAQAVVAGGVLRVEANIHSDSEHILLIFPQKVIAPGSTDWSLPDLWSDADRHRDRLVSHLSRIRFGEGLRFFIDPFGERLGARGEVGYLIPVSPSYRLEYAGWLSRKYATARDVGVAWSVLRHEIASFEEAARLVPMWRQGRGLAAVYDEETGRKHEVNVGRSSIWQDFHEFRTESVRAYINGIADVVKRIVADVPIVFTGNGLRPFFQGNSPVGFDGLAVPARSPADARADASAVFSLAQHSQQAVWIIARMGPGESGYEKKEELFSQINGLREFAVKGFFVYSFAAQNKIAGADLLVWLAEYGTSVASDTEFARYRPSAIYYPAAASDLSPTRLECGAWWLPALVPGHALELGERLAGYVLIESDGVRLYVWSRSGTRKVHVPAWKTATVITAWGERIEVKPRKGRIELTLTEAPILVQGIDPETFLPVEVVEEAIENLRAVVARAERKRMDVSSYEQTIKRAEQMVKASNLFVGLDMVQAATDELNQRLKGLEMAAPGTGESARSQGR